MIRLDGSIYELVLRKIIQSQNKALILVRGIRINTVIMKLKDILPEDLLSLLMEYIGEAIKSSS